MIWSPGLSRVWAACLVGTLALGTTFHLVGAEYVVTTTADNGPGSLRDALISANRERGADVIRFSVEGVIRLGSALPEVTDDTRMEGPGADRLRLSGGGAVQVLAFAAGTTNHATSLTIADGWATNGVHGAGISNAGSLTLVDCVVSGNRTVAGWGGGLFNQGDLTLAGCRVVSNSVAGGAGQLGVPGGAGGGGGGLGGGLFSSGGRLVLSNTVFEANLAEGGVGGTAGVEVTSGGAGGGPMGGAPGGQEDTNGKPGGLGGGGGGGGWQNIVDQSPTPGGIGGMGGVGGGGGGGGFAKFPFNPGGGSAFGGGLGTVGRSMLPNPGVGVGGGGAGMGGALFCEGTSSRLIRCRFQGNRAIGAAGGRASGSSGGAGGGFGGALLGRGGELVLEDSGIIGNEASGADGYVGVGGSHGGEAGGGAILLWDTVSTLVGSTISANVARAGATGRGTMGAPDLGAASWGGGVALLGGAAALTNCTLSGNLAQGGGGGAVSDMGRTGGTATGGGLTSISNSVVVVHCTLADNQAVGGMGGTSMAPLPGGAAGAAEGGGFHVVGGSMILGNSLVVGNTKNLGLVPSDGAGTVTSRGRNLLGTDAGMAGLSNADLKGADARLGPLMDNGGLTPTHALQRGSAAIDAAESNLAPPTDQRGFPRPTGPGPDVGAFERGPEAPGATVIRLDGEVVAPGGTVTYRGRVEVSMSTSFEKGTLLYTLDGSNPTHASMLYQGPWVLTNDARIRAFAYDGEFSATTPVAAVDVAIAADNRHLLTLTTSGQGTVDVTPSGERYDPGTLVRLTARAADGWRFAGWNGDTSGDSAYVELAMDSERAVSATFVPWAMVPLSASAKVYGVGSRPGENGPLLRQDWTTWVKLDPPGGMYPLNTLVTLTAEVPRISFAEGHTGFIRWTGDAEGNRPQVTVRMDRPRSVAAEFEFSRWFPGRYWLEVVTVGGGIALASPPPENLPVYVSGTGTPVDVTATPASGWSFLHWTGTVASTEPAISLGMGRDNYLEAVFGTRLRTVVSGAGTIEVSPNRDLHPGESRVRLLAVPQEGHAFARWGHAVSGTNNPMELTLREAEPTVAALFVPVSEDHVSLVVGVDGNGAVRREPDGNQHPIGTQVRITAEPEPGQMFVGWSGDGAGGEPTLLVTMDRDRRMRALFTQRPRLSLFDPFDYRAPESIRLRMVGEEGAWYAMETSANLKNWSRFTVVTNRGGASVLRLPQEGRSALFYRAVRMGP